MPIRRLGPLAAVGLLVAAVAITLWQGYQVQRDLTRAEASVAALRTALTDNDRVARDEAISDLQLASLSAADHTDGLWWGALTHIPYVGDDARGLRLVARTLSLVSTDGVAPMADSLDRAERLSTGGRLDLDVMESLRTPVGRASQVFSAAAAAIDGVDASGFFGILRQRYIEYASQLQIAATRLRSADVAVEILPDMLGAQGERDYLMLFQNNAEIRATGGMPGSWAYMHAERGRVDMVEQGTASDFPTSDVPVLPLTDAEMAIYGKEYGQFFQDPGFAPDFARGAELWNAHWERKFPGRDLDGILALDPVGMSYLLDGTGPVVVDGRTLTSDNVVDELLSRAYLELDAQQQDAFFEKAAAAIFDAMTEDLESPVALIEGFSRAAQEGRFLVAPFDSRDKARFGKSRVLGSLSSDEGSIPHVDIGINDATGSKMSYYLRYRASVEAQSCGGDRQQLSGRMTLTQTISPSAAAELPDHVTGGGSYLAEPGSQIVLLRIYGPFNGSIDTIMLNGSRVEAPEDNVKFRGRPVVTVVTVVSSRDDVVVTWQMETGEGQISPGRLKLTPSVVPGSNDRSFPSSCK